MANIILSEYDGTNDSGNLLITTTLVATTPASMFGLNPILNPSFNSFSPISVYTVSGTTDSRLNEVKLPNKTNPFIVNKPEHGKKWVRLIGVNNGREFIDYTIDKIRYRTFTDDDTTTFSVTSSSEVIMGFNGVLKPIIKEDFKTGVVFEPDIDEDIFIDRLNFSIFESHFRLAEIVNIEQLEDYSRGFFKISKE